MKEMTAAPVMAPTKQARVTVYLAPEYKDALERLAEKDQRTVSKYAAIALANVVDQAIERGEIPALTDGGDRNGE